MPLPAVAMKLKNWVGLLTIFFILSGMLPGQPVKAADKYQQGQLLVANPKMVDPRFARTVIFVCRHDSTGAFGLVLNRPVDNLSVQKFLDSIGIDLTKIKGSFQIRIGGPVELQSAYLMHNEEFGKDKHICKGHGVAVTSNIEMLKSLTEDAGPKRAVLFIGYAGWGAGQLEGELDRDSWSIVPGNQETLFDPDADSLWWRSMEKRGLDL